jgi:hypothetical protein
MHYNDLKYLKVCWKRGDNHWETCIYILTSIKQNCPGLINGRHLPWAKGSIFAQHFSRPQSEFASHHDFWTQTCLILHHFCAEHSLSFEQNPFWRNTHFQLRQYFDLGQSLFIRQSKRRHIEFWMKELKNCWHSGQFMCLSSLWQESDFCNIYSCLIIISRQSHMRRMPPVWLYQTPLVFARYSAKLLDRFC